MKIQCEPARKLIAEQFDFVSIYMIVRGVVGAVAVVVVVFIVSHHEMND